MSLMRFLQPCATESVYSRTALEMLRQVADSQRQEEVPRIGATTEQCRRCRVVLHLPNRRNRDLGRS